MQAAAEEEAEAGGMEPDINRFLAVAAGHSEPAEGGNVAPGSDREHLPAAASGPFAPSPGVRVRIQNLQRQVDYNGLLGTVEQEVGAGFFCVRLEDGSARRLRVRASNLLDASDSLTSSASPVATTAASSTVGASGPNHIHIDLQGAAMAGTGAWHAALPGSGGNLRVDIRPQHQSLSRDHAHSVSSILRQYSVAPRSPRHGVPPSSPSYGDASAAMLRAFNRMGLGSKFGLYFETGCTRLVYEALLQRNIQFALEPSEMRETLLRLSICLEAELVSARESVEAGEFGLAAAGAQAPDTPASSPATVPANLEVLGRLDLVTQEQRVTLWAVEVLKYGMPLETPLRQFHLAPRTVLQTPGSPQQQAVGLLVALGQHQHAASEWGEGSRVVGGAEGTAAPGVLDVLHLWLDTNASGILGAIPDARGASGSPHHQETAARPPLEEDGHRLGQPPSPADVMRQGQTRDNSESQSGRGPGSADQLQPEHSAEEDGAGQRLAAPATTQRLLTPLTPAELQAAGSILSQLERGQPPPSGEGSDRRLIHRLAQALSHQMFSAAFSGNLRVMEAVLSLPPRLLCATGIEAGLQQAGSLLQPLHMASYNGHATMVRFLLGRPGVSVNVPAGDHDSPLHKVPPACRHSRYKRCRAARGVCVKLTFDATQACFNAHSQVVLLLLEAGADPNATTPFSLERRTCAHGHHNNELRNGRRTPLHYTVKSS